MGRDSSYGDEQFRNQVDKNVTFTKGRVFVIMPFSKEEGFEDVYTAIDEECLKFGLKAE